MDYSSLFNMCSDALNHGKTWVAHEVMQAFIKYPVLAIPFIPALMMNLKKAVVKLMEALI